MGGVREDGLNWWLSLLAWRADWILANLDRINGRERAAKTEKDAHDALLNHAKMIGGIRDAAENVSCGAACRSLCCFFPQDNISSQVEEEKAEKIRSWAKGKGVRFEDYIREIMWESIPREYKCFLSGGEYAFKRDGDWRVYEVRNSGRKIDAIQASNLPRMNIGMPIWTDGDSTACSFLGEDGLCVLQAEGLKPGICREFVCSTAWAIDVARRMGAVRDDATGLSFPEQNRLADRLLSVFGSDDFRRLEMSYHSAFMDLAEAYADGREFAGRLLEYRRVQAMYFEKRPELFRRAVRPGFLGRLRLLFS